MLLKNAMVYGADFEPRRVEVALEGERIRCVAPALTKDGETLDLAGCTLVPGFIDIHIHGCGGADTGDATPEALRTISSTLVGHGVTSFCPTSMTLPFEELQKIFTNVQAEKDRLPGAYAHGVNMEGPFIALSKKGAQNGAYVRNPDPAEFRRLYEDCGGCIKLVDIAPESPGAEAFIKEVEPLCTVSMAHTAAGYDDAMAAIGWGVRHVTHLFNAMTGLTHREPGVVGAVFDTARRLGVRGELICDGFHIHPAALRIAFEMLGEDNAVAVSDSMRAASYRDGEYDLGGQPVYVRDGKALLADGTIAASTSNLHEEFCNLLRFGIPFRTALKAVTINPARAIRADGDTGSIEEGKLADLVALDEEMKVRLVVVKGRIMVNNL